MGIKVKKASKAISLEERELKRKKIQSKETLLMYKFLLVTLAMILGISAVLVIRNNGLITMNFLLYVQKPLIVLFGVLSIASLVYFIINRTKGVDESQRIITSVSLFAFMLAALTLMLSYSINTGYDTWRIISIIVVTALYFVYHIYDHVFFIVSSQCAIGLLAISILSKMSAISSPGIVIAVLTIVACSVIAYFALRFLSGQADAADYKFYIMTAIIVAGTVLSLFIPAITSYAIFALLAGYVVLAVISTIELM